MECGTVLWITGLSGAGKTTIGKMVYNSLKKDNDNVIFLDGDLLRNVFGNDLGYTLDDRKKSAMRYSRLCKMLSEQGMNVICSTISMFDECRDWNRENINNYIEIYIKVPMEILRQRNELYDRALSGEITNVMGIDLEVEEPKNPDLIINNNDEVSKEDIVEKILYNYYLKG